MSEWRRTPLAMHQRRGAGGGVRACGARERARARQRAERGESTGQRDSIADGTALRNIVGEEVAATLRTSEIRLGGSFLLRLYNQLSFIQGCLCIRLCV